MSYKAYLNIGSNKGDRIANIGQAVALITSLATEGRIIKSAPVETEPWGFDSPLRFINVGVVIETSLPPEELLTRLQEIERTISPTPHRDASGAYIDREIDIDIIVIDGIEIDTPRLTVPHPRMHLRDFVMKPLDELTLSSPWLEKYRNG